MPALLRNAFILTLFCWGFAGTAQGQSLLAEQRALTLEAAKIMAQAAEDAARQEGWNVVIAIVDEGGHLLYLQRMDGVQRPSVEVARLKARAAALYRRPTKVFSDRVAEGAQAVMMLPEVMPIEGGVPVVVDGQVLGGIGVSGVRSEQDGQVAAAGVAALMARLEE